jgi:hypothetical protein
MVALLCAAGVVPEHPASAAAAIPTAATHPILHISVVLPPSRPTRPIP